MTTDKRTTLPADVLKQIEHWSTTYRDPILAMPPGLQEAIAGTYLLARGIDEIEDHPELDALTKNLLLNGVSMALQTRAIDARLRRLFAGYRSTLPEVTLRLADWCRLPPPEIAPRIVDTFAAMAAHMAVWARRGWQIHDVDDLDHYMFSAACVMGMLLCDLWAWHDGTQVNRTLMMGCARGVQAANILADRAVDRSRGVDFAPDGWGVPELAKYVRTELAVADRLYISLPERSPAHVWLTASITGARAALEAAGRSADISVEGARR